MVLNPIFLGAVWFIIHRYCVFHTFIWRGWVGGLSQMKLTSFEKNCHISRRSLKYSLQKYLTFLYKIESMSINILRLKLHLNHF